MIEVLKQALEALESCTPQDTSTGHVIHAWHDEELVNKSITSLRQAIAELESQEPVAHQKWCASLTQLLLSMPPQPAPCNCHPPQRTWVGLTEDEIQVVAKQARSKDHAVTLTNKLLREKNK